jgi:hypothetical protein
MITVAFILFILSIPVNKGSAVLSGFSCPLIGNIQDN